jgi:flagellar basal-body rod modification protein FlgD
MVASVTSTAASSAASSTASSTAGTTSAQAQTDRFMKLLVAQLNNQDPMNPMDNSQMTSQIAQINTVSGIQDLNTTMKSIATQFGAMQSMQGASMIGHTVQADGNTLSMDNSSGSPVGTGAFNIAADASSVTVKVMSPGGQLLDTVNLGAVTAGNHSFNWTPTNYSGTGTPTFSITANQGSQTITSSTFVQDTVASVNTDATTGTLNLALKGGTTVAYSAVKSIY